jgi:inhibitor of cysteine peptidase
MLTTLIRTMIGAAAAVAMLSCAAPGSLASGSRSEVAIDQRASGATIALRVGQKLVLSLPANPTTGYLWQVEPGAERILAQQGEGKFVVESSAIGAGGVITFSFKAVAEGEGALRLRYVRSFQPESAADTFQVSVVVTK